MDQQKLRTLVFEKTGVKIDIDDPIFALVALNEAVLAEAVERHVALLDQASARLADQAGLPQDAPPAWRAEGDSTSAPPAPLPKPALAAPSGKQDWHQPATAAGAALLGAVLVLLGQALWFKPAPIPPSTVIAKELTPEQAQAIRNGEKLGAIVQKLDAKTRNAIQAEMQKP
ncbi:hypothetical protein [Massilia sp. CF038]|uniref:hypothetical protein n=1 Tax=Massilia sp. CF038 TaxID=1881045 RepID=UPI000921A2FB|nr:hypothetical protein [Massilia sp. CF038]SHH51912.1 hypothetical protein SAMN05428948_4264 [Massilia sp. CF038]